MTFEIKDRIKTMSLETTGTIRQAMQAIDRGALGMALLMDPETRRFEGLVTDGDIRRALLNGLGLESPVDTIPRPIPKTATAGMSMEKVAALFSDPVRVVPLLNDEGQVVDLAVFDRRMHLPVAKPSLGEKELLYVTECILTGWVSSAGKFVSRFEELFAEFCGARYAISTCNGTTALHLALLALNIGPGDEVIVPALTFIATANAVRYTGASPVLVDSEPETWNIDPDQIEAVITPKTKAIIPVHLYGHPANMDPIMDIAEQHGLAIVEDSAQAHGACYKGRRAGSMGDMGSFSFYGNKIITTGEGGMIVTNRADWAEKIRILRDHGMSPERRYWHPVLGYNYRMTNIQAALGAAQMEKIDAILQIKTRLAGQYAEALRDMPWITLPPQANWARNVYWLYTVLVDWESLDISRDEAQKVLNHHHIETRPVFIPLHQQPLYSSGKRFPVAEKLSRLGLSLPSAPTMTQEEIQRVADHLKMVLRPKVKGSVYR